MRTLHTLGLILLCGLWLTVPALAQTATPASTDDDSALLTADNVRIETQRDAFGQTVQVLLGDLRNTGDSAYENIEVSAELLNDDEELIGEGFGFVVDACGNAILDFPLQPSQSQRFRLAVDVYDSDTTADDIAEIVVQAEGDTTHPEALDLPNPDSVTQLDNREVVAVQWIDENTLRYGIGCDGRVFTSYDWYRYDLSAGEATRLDAHPAEANITDAFLRQTGINQITQSREDDPTLFETSYLTFPEQSRRIVYQTDINTVVTAERDGSFKRVVHGVLSRYSLQGYIWSPAGNFAAYYFGAYGEPVRYFTAAASGTLISALLPNNPTSQTVPGLTNDARRVIISGTFPADPASTADDVETQTGYFLQSVVSPQRELLFEASNLPGNNYPAPAYFLKDANTRYIYIVRPLYENNVLQCFHREADELYTLTELPLFLTSDERAGSWLAPDGSTLAIAANGDHSGLWLVDLTAFDVCQ